MTQETVVCSWNEWDPLEHIIVGRATGTMVQAPEIAVKRDWPEEGYPYPTYGPYPQDMQDAADEQLDDLATMSETRGIRVDRPALFDFSQTVTTPDWEQESMFGCMPPRDLLLTVGPEILEATGETLRSLGASVDLIELDWSDRALETAETHLQFPMGNILRASVPEESCDALTPYVRDFFNEDPVSVEEWTESWKYADEMHTELQQKVFLAGYDVLVCPTIETTSIAADFGRPGSGTTASLNDMLAVVMTVPFNVLGKLPVVNMPIGIAPSTGVPIGMQIVGPPNADPVPFRLAAGLEVANGPLFDRMRPDFS